MFLLKRQRLPLTSPALRSFLRFCRPWYGKIAMTSVVFVIANIMIAVLPIFIGALIDTISQAHVNSSQAWLYAIILMLLSSGHDMLWHVGEFAYRAMILPITFRYESHLFDSVVHKPYPYFVDKFTGKIGSYITNISGEFRSILDNALFNYIASVINVVSVIWITSHVNWQTGAIIGACLLLMLAIGKYTLAKDMAMQKIEADAGSTKNGRIIDSIGNFVSIKSFHKELSEIAHINHQQDLTLTAAKRSFFWGIVFWASMSVIIRHLMWPGVIGLNLWIFLKGDISVGQFATIISTALMFSQTIWEIVWNIAQFGQRLSRINEAHHYLFGDEVLPRPRNETKSLVARTTSYKQFGINNLTFAYPDKVDTVVLSGITLTIRHGEKVGIVGRSGSGKSTLVKLLLDQYETPHGTFAFDENSVSSHQLSHMIAYVPQDTTLFHRSIAENIRYAAGENISRKAIERAAQKAEADEFIVKLPQGYDTLVGERGVKLSGGQRQRIAIARAILKDAPILVLDEATSALDSESELHVQKAIENLWHNKTVIAIAHRLSTLRHMDRIVVMENGRIVEQGTHSELIALSGVYAKLWSHQSGGFIEE
ncbi:MAG: ABC transporter ATP-binding protein [Candidatus Saccharimonadales bacterium]